MELRSESLGRRVAPPRALEPGILAGISPAAGFGGAFAAAAVTAALGHSPVLAGLAVMVAAGLGFAARRRALKARFPTIGELRSMVAGTLVITACFLAVLIAVLPYAVRQLHH